MNRPVGFFFKLPSIAILISASLIAGCHSAADKTGSGPDSAGSAGKTPKLPPIKHNPEDRSTVSKDPVAEYKVKTDDKLNNQYFLVRLYETSKTMRYRVTMEYEGLTGEDTVKLPDLGTPPHPVLQKGPEHYSCILGVIDNDRNFREMKKIFVTPDEESLKITTLKHYVVSGNYRLVSQ